MKKIISTLLAIVAIAGTLYAQQTPKGFNYQMVVRNSTGKLIDNKAVKVKLNINQGSPNGTSVYNHTETYTTNANGLVTLVVGNGSADYANINWGNGPYYLVSEVDPDGGNNFTLRTVQQILAVPYAEYASVADHISHNFTIEWDSITNHPIYLSQFINDLPPIVLLWDSIVGRPTNLSQFNNDLTIDWTDINNRPTTIEWDSVVNHPVRLSQFQNDLTIEFDSIHGFPTTFDWDSIVGRPTNLSQFNNDLTINWDSIVDRPTNLSQFNNDLTIDWTDINNRPTTIEWDSVVNHPVRLSQFQNDLTIEFDSIHGFPTTFDWDSITNRPTNLSQFVNDLVIEWDSIQGFPTTLEWDSITNRPTSLSQFTNDLGFYISGDTLYMGDQYIVMPTNSGLSIHWTDIIGRPSNLSDFNNDLGYLTAESQNLADVLANGTSAGNRQIRDLAMPSTGADAANKTYVDAAIEAEASRADARVDSLLAALDSLRNDMNDSIAQLRNEINNIQASLADSLDSLRNQITQLNNTMDSITDASNNTIDSISTALYNYQHSQVEGELNGIFSVSATKKVRFSCGNLQYRPRSSTWRFATTQYGYSGSDNNDIAYHEICTSWIDLFGYATSGWKTGAAYYMPYSTASDDQGYTESTGGNDLTDMYRNGDWGCYNPIINGGNQTGMWRTLTNEEWSYLLIDRPNAANLRGMATVGSATGLILLPDNWEAPAGVVFDFDPTATVYTANNYSISTWTQLEAAGAVFLPSAGIRTTTSANQIGVQGHYWSSSHVNGDLNHSVSIIPGTGVNPSQTPSSRGCSVRLVRDY